MQVQPNDKAAPDYGRRIRENNSAGEERASLSNPNSPFAHGHFRQFMAPSLLRRPRKETVRWGFIESQDVTDDVLQRLCLRTLA